MTKDELLRDLLLEKLRHPWTEALYAYRASRTAFEPYQFRPALKFFNSPDQGLLIADEVGLGKTIEAAIVYLELKARMDISRVLILCPSRLTGKWQDELRNRFEEEFEILDSDRISRLTNDLKRHGPGMPLKAIGSYELLRRGYLELVREHLALDLLIMDEAHYVRNRNTATYDLGLSMVNAADATILLSATPLQMHSSDLYSLLNLIAPADFEDINVFDDQLHPNEFINRALRFLAAGSPSHALRELRHVEQTKVSERFMNNPYYDQVLTRLRSMDASTSRAERVSLQRSIMQLNTLDSVMTRTRKREVAHAAVRVASTVSIELTTPEREFYDSVLHQVRQDLLSQNRDARGFATIMKERQAASCLPALQAALQEARHRADFELDPDVSQFDPHVDEDERAAAHIRAPISGLMGGTSLHLVDTKYREFVNILEEVLNEDPTSKVLVFSFFKRTLKYLHDRLRRDGLAADVIHGDVAMKDRYRVIERFATDPKQRILLSSEVGAEGLDFQFCDVLINYDLPWNPMQVEQRIGRLDRFGQKHERIRIFNFYLAESIETRIFQRLYDRIGIFERSIGDLEAILGEEISKISRAVIQARLTPKEEEMLAEQAADRILKRQHAEDELEKSQDALLGTGPILDQHVTQTITSGKVISPQEVSALVRTFLAHKFPHTRLEEDADEPCWSLKLDSGLVKYISDTVEQNKSLNRLSESFKSAMYDKGWTALTFDSELARDRSLLEFVTIRHPLAEAAIRYWREQPPEGVPAARVAVGPPSGTTRAGSYFIYFVEVKSIKPQILLECVLVADNGTISHDHAGKVLQAMTSTGAVSAVTTQDTDQIETAQSIADRMIAQYRDEIERKALTDNEVLVATRSASVETSFAAKIERTMALARNAPEERIRRMRTSEAENLLRKRDVRLREVRTAQHVAVTSRLIACGRYDIGVDA